MPELLRLARNMFAARCKHVRRLRRSWDTLCVTFYVFFAVGFVCVARRSANSRHDTRRDGTTRRARALSLSPTRTCARVRSWQHIAATCGVLTFGNRLNCCFMQPINRQAEYVCVSVCVWVGACVMLCVCVFVCVCDLLQAVINLRSPLAARNINKNMHNFHKSFMARGCGGGDCV